MKAREELKNWIAAAGRTQADVARALKLSGVKLHRLIHGAGTLEPGQLDALEKLTGISGLATRLAAEGPRGRNRAARSNVLPLRPRVPAAAAAGGDAEEPSLPPPINPAVVAAQAAELAGEVDEEDVGGSLSRHLSSMYGVLINLALTGKTEGVRRAAAVDVLDRIQGRPPQRIINVPPPEAPLVDSALIEELDRIAASGQAAAGESGATAPQAEPAPPAKAGDGHG